MHSLQRGMVGSCLLSLIAFAQSLPASAGMLGNQINVVHFRESHGIVADVTNLVSSRGWEFAHLTYSSARTLVEAFVDADDETVTIGFRHIAGDLGLSDGDVHIFYLKDIAFNDPPESLAQLELMDKVGNDYVEFSSSRNSIKVIWTGFGVGVGQIEQITLRVRTFGPACTITNLAPDGDHSLLQWQDTAEQYVVEQTTNLSLGFEAMNRTVISNNWAQTTNETQACFYRVDTVEPVTFRDSVFGEVVRDAIRSKYLPESDVFSVEFKGIATCLCTRDALANAQELCWMKNLVYASFTNTALRILDLSEAGRLRRVDAMSNKRLRWLEVTGCGLLEELNCGGCQTLYMLDVAGCTLLRKLICSGTYVSTLSLGSHGQLRDLICDNSRMKKLSLSACQNLTNLSVRNASMYGQLDLSSLTNLIYVDVRDNELTNIIVRSLNALPATFLFDSDVTLSEP